MSGRRTGGTARGALLAGGVARLGARVLGARRRALLGDQVRRWRFASQDRLPALPLVDLFDGVESVRCGATATNRHHFELPYAERFLLDVIVRSIDARTIFEFGTYRGSTTRLLAEAAGAGGAVHTIDRPRRTDAGEEDVIGSELRRSPIDGAPVTEHRQDTAEFDFGPYEDTFDLVLVDAGHDEEDVARDSSDALRIVRPGGVVVWDDYHAAQPGVVAALNDLSEQLPLVRIEWSRLVVLNGAP